MRSLRWPGGALSVAAAFALSLSWPGAAAADQPGETWSGTVVSSHSRWARGGRDIVTESVLRTADGHEITVHQLGGSVDGIGERLEPSPPLLQVGDQVTAQVRLARDLRGRVTRVVRGLYAPGQAGALATGGEPAPFVRTVATKTRVPLAWESSCAQITYQDAGTTDIAGDAEFAAMDAVIDNWNNVTSSCSYLTLQSVGRAPDEVGLDGVNLVVFRGDRWCRPATDSDPEECYDPSAAGLTTLRFIDDASSDRNGAILDADIELNAVDYSIAIDGQTTRPGNCISDLANTLTHEVGHLMGLDHTCWNGGDRLDDDQGNPVPSCAGSLPTSITDSTMYNFQDCGETKKATPEADDIAGVCAIYPKADDPGQCSPPDLGGGGCCAIAGAHSSGARGPTLLLLAAALILLRRRRS